MQAQINGFHLKGKATSKQVLVSRLKTTKPIIAFIIPKCAQAAYHCPALGSAVNGRLCNHNQNSILSFTFPTTYWYSIINSTNMQTEQVAIQLLFNMFSIKLATIQRLLNVRNLIFFKGKCFLAMVQSALLTYSRLIQSHLACAK